MVWKRTLTAWDIFSFKYETKPVHSTMVDVVNGKPTVYAAYVK